MKEFNYCKSGYFKKPNKYWELQVTNAFEGPYFNFSINWTRKQDHAGLTILFECFSFMFDWKVFYDIRHWDWVNNCYEK